MSIRRWSTAALLVVTFAACASEPSEPGPAPDPEPIGEVSRFALASLGLGDLRATGVSRDGRTGNLWLLTSLGLVEVSPAGKLVSQLRYGERGLSGRFTDVAVLADGRFILTANGEGFRYDPTTAKLDFFFCLLPALDPIEMQNDAVTLDETTARIFVAPVYYDSSSGERTLVRALLAQYAAGDGQALVEHDVMASHVIARGLAFDPTTRGVWAAEGSRLVHFTADGKTDGREVALTGIEDAAGVTLAGDKLWVLDAADGELRAFARP